MKIYREWVEQRHEYAKDWKERTGGKVVGCFCTYVPEEILYAAGLLPVRIMGSHEPDDVTEPHIFRIYCPFCRDSLAQGLNNKYDYLSGIVKARSCENMRNAFFSWKRNIPMEYTHYVTLPALLQSPGARDYYLGALVEFKKSLEEWTENPISEEALKDAIKIYNTNRRLLGQLYELRKSDNPPITGTEALTITMAGQFVDKEEHSQLLSQTLETVSAKKDNPFPDLRLMLIGTEVDDIELVELIESTGALVVVDDMCTGTRYFWNECAVDKKPLEAITDRYIERPLCPAKDVPERRRWPHISRLIDDYNVEGVIIVQQKFCEPLEFDIPYLKARLNEKDIPSLLLEYDLTTSKGQFQMRVEAFLETLLLEVI